MGKWNLSGASCRDQPYRLMPHKTNQSIPCFCLYIHRTSLSFASVLYSFYYFFRCMCLSCIFFYRNTYQISGQTTLLGRAGSFETLHRGSGVPQEALPSRRHRETLRAGWIGTLPRPWDALGQESSKGVTRAAMGGGTTHPMFAAAEVRFIATQVCILYQRNGRLYTQRCQFPIGCIQ